MKASAFLTLASFLVALPADANVRRVIIFKFDGVNADFLNKRIDERDPRTGRSQLPWMEQIFARQGTRFDHFYTRGISLSAPSWAMLDTGQHQVIRGNVEYDRWTLHAYDYLNFFPFYFNYSQKKQVDMPGVEVLDDAGIPLIIDALEPSERWQSFQLYQRGNQWSILERSLPDHFRGHSPKEWFDEWQTGLEVESSIPQEMEQQLIQALADDRIAYFDFFSGDFDHVAHLTNDPESQLHALQGLDALLGRIWTAAMASKLGPHTVAVIVSDHGINTQPDVLSQGYSLVDWFNSPDGGGNHVVTDRYPLSTLKLRGLDPFTHKVSNASVESPYLKGEAQRYPTVLLDVDGNERAAAQLRSNDWNIAQLLLQQAAAQPSSPELRAACRAELERWASARRESWNITKAELLEELKTVDRAAGVAEQAFEEQNLKHWSADDRRTLRYLAVRRYQVRAQRLRSEADEFRKFIAARDALLAMPSNADGTLIPKESLGDANSLFDLQNYVVGPAPGGIVLKDHALDLNRSFRRIDYFQAIASIHVRNQVQKGMSNRPIDFLAAKLDTHAAEIAFNEPNLTGAVWLYAGADRQAVVLFRNSLQRLTIRYIPVSDLRAQPTGIFGFVLQNWTARFPLQIFEDAALKVPQTDRTAWLSSWHDEEEWFSALRDTRYSNGLIGIVEQFQPIRIALPAWASVLSPEDRDAWLRWERRRRDLVQPDLEIFAADHWNFNVRSVNPGGNHGSFLSVSTHSVLMFAGGADTGLPRGVRVEVPYDSLNFAPTVLKLLNRSITPEPSGTPIPEITGTKP